MLKPYLFTAYINFNFTAGVRNGLVIQFWLTKGFYYREDNYPLYVAFILLTWYSI